jgi:hypothetical protein
MDEQGKDRTTRVSRPYYSSAVYTDPITSVRIVNTIPDAVFPTAVLYQEAFSGYLQSFKDNC